jgi:hypothetical protein
VVFAAKVGPKPAFFLAGVESALDSGAARRRRALVVVTGSNSGIGLARAVALARAGL